MKKMRYWCKSSSEKTRYKICLKILHALFPLHNTHSEILETSAAVFWCPSYYVIPTYDAVRCISWRNKLVSATDKNLKAITQDCRKPIHLVAKTFVFLVVSGWVTPLPQRLWHKSNQYLVSESTRVRGRMTGKVICSPIGQGIIEYWRAGFWRLGIFSKRSF